MTAFGTFSGWAMCLVWARTDGRRHRMLRKELYPTRAACRAAIAAEQARHRLKTTRRGGDYGLLTVDAVRVKGTLFEDGTTR